MPHRSNLRFFLSRFCGGYPRVRREHLITVSEPKPARMKRGLADLPPSTQESSPPIADPFRLSS